MEQYLRQLVEIEFQDKKQIFSGKLPIHKKTKLEVRSPNRQTKDHMNYLTGLNLKRKKEFLNLSIIKF